MARRPHSEASLRRGSPTPRCPRAETPPCRDAPVPSRTLYRPVSPMTSAAERQGRSRD